MLGQNFHVTTYTAANGLPTDKVKHLVQDKVGYLWLATSNGLVKFNGTTFFHFDKQIPSQEGAYFASMQDTIYYAHQAGISIIYSLPDSVRFENTLEASIDPSDTSLYYPSKLFTQPNGTIWISQPNGEIVRYQQGKATAFSVEKSMKKVPYQYYFTTMGNTLIVASSSGKVFKWINGNFEKVMQLSKLSDLKKIGNQLWLVGDDIHELTFDSTLQVVKSKTYTNTIGFITALEVDSKGDFYVGVQNKGLYLLNKKEEETLEFIKIFANNDPQRINELPFKNINSIIDNDNQQLFICSDEGFGILQKRFFESVRGLPNDNITSIAVGDNGKVYANLGDIYQIAPTRFGFNSLALPDANLGIVNTTTVDNEDIWVGTLTGILAKLDENGKVLKQIDLSQRGDGIFYLQKDKAGSLWICQAPAEQPIDGIGRLLADGTVKEYGKNEGVDDRILVVKQTKRGRIYAGGIGINSYLYRYIPEDDIFVNLSLPLEFYVSPNFEVHDLTVDSAGIVWLATTDGLLSYNIERVQKIDLGEYNDLEIRAITHTSDGTLWLSTNTEGILRYKNGQLLNMKEESGLPSKIMSYRAISTDAAERVWVGTAEGLVYTLQQSPSPQPTSTPILLNVEIDDIKKQTVDNISLFKNQKLTINFIAPNYHSFRTFFQYKIEGQGWSAPFTTTNVELQNLTAGKKQVLIRAKKEGGNLWSDPLIVEVKVKNRWYENHIWQIAAGVMILAWAVIYLKLGQRRFRLKLEALNTELEHEKEENEKVEEDLEKAKAEIEVEKMELKLNLLSFEILKRLITKIEAETPWQEALKLTESYLLKIPGVNGFELATLEGDKINLEGYSERTKDFFKNKIAASHNFINSCIHSKKPFTISDLQQHLINTLQTEERLTEFKSAVIVPFSFKKQPSALILYADRLDYFDEYNIKAMEVFAAYLNRIY